MELYSILVSFVQVVESEGMYNRFSTMKLFHFVRKFYQTIGIDLTESGETKSPFNAKNVLPLLCQVQMFASAFGAFLFEVTSISDCGMAFYASITGFAMANFFSMLISNSPFIHKLIVKFEEFIEKSKLAQFDSFKVDSTRNPFQLNFQGSPVRNSTRRLQTLNGCPILCT